MAGEKWMYDMFGTTGKSIYERQKKQCAAAGGTYDRETGKCNNTKKPEKDKDKDKS